MTQRHFIQRHILNVLMQQKYARFRDLRPPRVDSNVFSYHLTAIKKEHLVTKEAEGYTLTIKGLAHVDLLSMEKTHVRQQPRIMTMILVRNEAQELIAYHKNHQPFIGQLTLPSGKLHLDDSTIEFAAKRELKEKTSIVVPELTRLGDCYMAMYQDDEVVMNSLVHVFLADVSRSDVTLEEGVSWYNLAEFTQAAPASRRVVEELYELERATPFFREYREGM